ncbi:MAG: Crp/Fnr family transcriptional regulator [Chloroflexi bacterium]|nr:Crp/Fnr family transcriptional regulator [Chloroflexota bacterium]
MAIEVALLKSIPYFLGLSTAELEAIRKYVFEQAVGKNDMILMEGDPANAVYFVVSGAVKVFKTSVEGKEQILCILRPGESFNDVAVFDGGPNPASAIAMTPVLLYGINRANVETILRDYPNLAANVIRILSKKVRHFVSLVEDLSFRHVTDRLAKLLLEYATDHGTVAGEPGARPRLTQQEMAAVVGTAREVVGRSLKALEEEGAIRMDRHRIVIVNKKRLEQMSGVGAGSG